MFDFIHTLFDTSDFPPRWHCGSWTTAHGWAHILSDLGIFGAYLAIPAVLATFALRRRDVPFPRIMWLFVAFIFACGTTHLIEAIIFWQPIYRISAMVKVATAAVSWATVLALAQVIPQALHLPGQARLNDDLKREVAERTRIEAALRRGEKQLSSLLASERKARSDLERAHRIKDEFLATISHELRTPLSAILGYAQLLLHKNHPAGLLQEGLEDIERNAKAQAQIIDDLLDMSRITSGQVRLNLRPVHVTQVLDDATATFQAAAAAKNITLETQFDSEPTVVAGDSGRLQQVFWNLLSNAIKFTPNGGRVTASVAWRAPQVEVSISDTGEGIDAEFLPYVFERFRQEDPTISRRHGGLGLGLSIVKHLVELHGGTVEVRSPGKGQGATFTVRLPMASSVDGVPIPRFRENPRREPETSQAVSLVGLRIIVVDDEPDSRAVVRHMLAERGAQVTVASNADEALDRIRETNVDLLVSDLGMPEKDGYDLIREVRRMSPRSGNVMAAIALTALTRSEDRTRALLAGYQAHLAKPVDPDELIAVVAALAGRTGQFPATDQPGPDAAAQNEGVA